MPGSRVLVTKKKKKQTFFLDKLFVLFSWERWCSRRINRRVCHQTPQFFCGLVCDLSPLWTRRNSRRTPPITPPPPFCLRRSRQIRERKVFFFFFLLLLGNLGELFRDIPCTLKTGASSENFSFSKWVYSQKTFAAKLMHPEKTFLQNGYIRRKLFFKMGVSRKNINSLSFTEIRKIIILSFKVSYHIIKASLLMWLSLKSKLSLNSEANAADQCKDPFLVPPPPPPLPSHVSPPPPPSLPPSLTAETPLHTGGGGLPSHTLALPSQTIFFYKSVFLGGLKVCNSKILAVQTS